MFGAALLVDRGGGRTAASAIPAGSSGSTAGFFAATFHRPSQRSVEWSAAVKTAMRFDPIVATLVAMCIVSTNAMAPGTTSVDETQTHAETRIAP